MRGDKETLARKASKPVELNIETTVAGYMMIQQALDDFAADNPLYTESVGELKGAIERDAPELETDIRDLNSTLPALFMEQNVEVETVQEGSDAR